MITDGVMFKGDTSHADEMKAAFDAWVTRTLVCPKCEASYTGRTLPGMMCMNMVPAVMKSMSDVPCQGIIIDLDTELLRAREIYDPVVVYVSVLDKARAYPERVKGLLRNLTSWMH